MPKKRSSKLGVQRGERYALLPEEVMESVAYHAQPDWARSVLNALACRYHGRNNGDLSLPMSEARRLGIAAQWKLYAGLRLLELADLIRCTRRGRLERGTKLCSLYAITWRGIDQCEGIEFDSGVHVCPIPTHAWAKWKKPDDWGNVVKQINRANRGRKIPVSTHGGLSRSTHDGAKRPKTAPPLMDKGKAILAPSMMDTSKNSAQGLRKIRKLMQLQEHLPDCDISKITGEPIELVQQVRRQLETQRC